MNAVKMLTQCRARQDNVPANDGTSETVACSMEDLAPESPIGNVHLLPGPWELAQEAKSLGLDG